MCFIPSARRALAPIQYLFYTYVLLFLWPRELIGDTSLNVKAPANLQEWVSMAFQTSAAKIVLFCLAGKTRVHFKCLYTAGQLGSKGCNPGAFP